jgi:GxxExxY protein
LKHSRITSKIIGVFYEVYNELGAGFLESVYAEAMAVALSEAGLSTEREMPLSVFFRGTMVGRFRADLVVQGAVLVETKACSRLRRVHEAQDLNYLRATVLEVGLLLNFGPRPKFKRLLYDNSHKRHKIPGQPSHERLTHIPIRLHPCSSVAR